MKRQKRNVIIRKSKQRLEKIKNWKSDIIVSVDTMLEDTVGRAEDKFKKYDCVKSASDNTFLKQTELLRQIILQQLMTHSLIKRYSGILKRWMYQEHGTNLSM